LPVSTSERSSTLSANDARHWRTRFAKGMISSQELEKRFAVADVTHQVALLPRILLSIEEQRRCPLLVEFSLVTLAHHTDMLKIFTDGDRAMLPQAAFDHTAQGSRLHIATDFGSGEVEHRRTDVHEFDDCGRSPSAPTRAAASRRHNDQRNLDSRIEEIRFV
jgi:hypothetical protein